MERPMAIASNKTCTCCGLDKLESDYYRDKRASHGLCAQCKECMNERKKAKRIADPDAARRAWRDDYRNNKDRYLRAANTYRAKNAEKFREWSRNGSNKSRPGAGSNAPAGREFYEWVSAQEKKCTWCGVECADDFQVDHVVPLAAGGRHELGNFAISCFPCNRRKSSKLPDEFLAEIGRG